LLDVYGFFFHCDRRFADLRPRRAFHVITAQRWRYCGGINRQGYPLLLFLPSATSALRRDADIEPEIWKHIQRALLPLYRPTKRQRFGDSLSGPSQAQPVNC
jgi:hypothetical protein